MKFPLVAETHMRASGAELFMVLCAFLKLPHLSLQLFFSPPSRSAAEEKTCDAAISPDRVFPSSVPVFSDDGDDLLVGTSHDTTWSYWLFLMLNACDHQPVKLPEQKLRNEPIHPSFQKISAQHFD